MCLSGPEAEGGGWCLSSSPPTLYSPDGKPVFGDTDSRHPGVRATQCKSLVAHKVVCFNPVSLIYLRLLFTFRPRQTVCLSGSGAEGGVVLSLSPPILYLSGGTLVFCNMDS